MKNKIYIIIIIVFCFKTLYAQDKTVLSDKKADIPQNEKVCFFNFQDKSAIDKYSYLSYIIPNSVGADLKNLGNYEIITMSEKINFLGKNSSADDRMKFINAMNQKGKENKCDYLITGSYFIEGNNIIIYSQIFDAERQEIIYVDETENKISAVMLEMIEELADDIKDELDEAKELREEERERREAERLANISPFLGLYDFFNGMTFGANYGNIKFMDSWTDEFADTEIVTLYFSYYLSNINFLKNTSMIKNIGFIGKYEYFATRSEDYYFHRSVNLEFTGYGLNISYLFRITNLFNIALSGGGGMSKVELMMEPDYDDTDTLVEPGFSDTNNDLFYNITCSMNFFFRNIKLESGFSYYYVQHSPDKISFITLYFGLGYRI